MVKIISWNVNGVRALPSNLTNTLKSFDSDIVCFQETKITRDQLDVTISLVEGYNAYYSFCQKRSGYSGVAIFCRNPFIPCAAFNCLGKVDGCSYNGNFTDEEISNLDSEGRVSIVQFDAKCCGGASHKLTIINVYCPRADSEQPERMRFKMDFHHLLQLRAEQLAQHGHVIIAGDLNISHRRIDHCDPEGTRRGRSDVVHEEFVAKTARHWIDHLLISEQRDPEIEDFADKKPELRVGQGGIFADTFRVLNPDVEKAYTCWLTVTGARETNYGNRIDYILADNVFTEQSLRASAILPEVVGSDHCPVAAEFDVTLLPADKCPPLCTRFLPEFQGTQRKISDFFSAKGATKSASFSSSAAKRPAGQSRLDSFLSAPAKKPKLTSFEVQPKVEIQSKGDARPKVSATASAWKQILKGPEAAPLCRGHEEPCVLRTVKKDSLNKGRQFWVCSHPEGPPTDPKSRCDFFVWVEKKKKS